MAYLFDDTNNQYLEATYADENQFAMTFAAWFRLDAAVPAGEGFTIVSNGYASLAPPLMMLRVDGDQKLCALYVDNLWNIGNAITSATVSTGTWYHGAGVLASDTSRSVYLDGANKVTDTTNAFGGLVYNRTDIGRRAWSTGGQHFSGDIAEPAIWKAVLTDDEVAALAKGASPLIIRPGSLWFYAPLVRQLNNVKRSLGLTGYGDSSTTPTVSAHPRVYNPAISLTKIAGGIAYVPRTRIVTC